MTTKADIINGAYSQLRISGLTVQPTPEDLSLALDRLEGMMAEFSGRNICVGYNFETTPDSGTDHNVDREFWFALETNLAVRLIADFGKNIPPSLMAYSQAGFSFLSSATAPIKQVAYPSRQPKGSGSTLRYNRFQRYYRPQAEAPQECETNVLYVDDINDYTESFDTYLKDPETVSSYTIEADTGLTIVSDSLASPIVSYRIRADGYPDGTARDLLQVKIVVTTSLGRITTRIINFKLLDSDI